MEEMPEEKEIRAKTATLLAPEKPTEGTWLGNADPQAKS